MGPSTVIGPAIVIETCWPSSDGIVCRGRIFSTAQDTNGPVTVIAFVALPGTKIGPGIVRLVISNGPLSTKDPPSFGPQSICGIFTDTQEMGPGIVIVPALELGSIIRSFGTSGFVT